MVDYIRGKKAYTKWDADTENVDIEYHDGQPLKTSPIKGWLSGAKGNAIKILLVLLLFCLGLVIGYFIQRGVHEHTIILSQNAVPLAFSYNSMYADILQQHITKRHIKEFLRNLSLKPHVAGQTSGREIANTIQIQWSHNGLDDVRIESYLVLLPYPPSNGSNTVSIVDDVANHTVDVLSDVPRTTELKPFFAYSGIGTATGKLVYANYGRQEDFQHLDALNVTVNGSIVIMRLGKSHRGDKVRWAEERGAIGALLYPDPAEYVSNFKLYPEGLGLPGNAVVYGSLKTYPGDPETPGLPSIDAAYRLPRGSNLGLRSIPAQPISYNDARKLLSKMEGPDPPAEWIGGLNVTYRLGPGFLVPNNNEKLKLEVKNEFHRSKIFNVIGVIYGKYEKDEYVILGCHHDTWTTSASDPGSGMAVLLEIVQAFAQLRQTGWAPCRSIVFVSWDAEEYGVIGSTEWVEDHAKELVDNAVAYINIDSAVTGNHTLHALGSPLLKKVLFEAASEVSHHVNGQETTAYNVWRLRNPHNSSSKDLRPRMDILGTGSDFVSFMSGYGIPSVHIQFINKDLDTDYPLYHTDYDIYDAVANYTDPSFNASVTLARLVATLVMKLSDSLMLPFDCHDYTQALKRGVGELKNEYDAYLTDHEVNLDIILKAIHYFESAVHTHSEDFARSNETSTILAYHEYNHQLMQIERTFILPRGVRDSPIFRHAIFGPHPHDLHRGVIFPGIVDSILRAQQYNSTSASIDAIRLQVAEVVQVLQAAGSMLISSVVSRYAADSLS